MGADSREGVLQGEHSPSKLKIHLSLHIFTELQPRDDGGLGEPGSLNEHLGAQEGQHEMINT